MKQKDYNEVMTLYQQKLPLLYLSAACEKGRDKLVNFFVGFTFLYDVYVIYNRRKRRFERLECWDIEDFIEEVIEI